jgi:PAS domain S-box-containing protein
MKMKNKSIEQYINELVETGVFESIGDGISIQNTDYKILYQNSKHKSIIGNHSGEYCYKAYEQRDHYCEGCPLAMTFDDGLTHTAERTASQAPNDRGLLHVEITASPLRDETGKIIAGIEVVRDITERKTNEEALREKEEKYRLLFSAEMDAIIMVDADTLRIIDANDSASSLYGYSKEEILKLTGPDLSAEPKKSEVAIKELIMATNKNIHFHRRYHKKKDGTVFPVEISSGTFILKDKKIISAVIRDTTERKKLEDELQKSHKLESLGILAGGIAHDFNNLLAGIMNNVYLSKMNIEKESKTYHQLESAEKAIWRASNLTQQLLTFSRGGSPVKRTSSISEIIKETIDFTLRGSNVKCEYKISEKIWPVNVDKGQISQVIQNIIINAEQAIPGGGTIMIEIENALFGSDTGMSLKGGRFIKITIHDQGTGISEDHLQKIFDPYFTTKEMGRGLGLAITYSIIKNHDGHISVESELGQGTTFDIYLPASERQIVTKQVSEDRSQTGEGRVLIMDDEEFIRSSLGEILIHNGYEVEFASDGSEAVEIYKKAMKSSKPFDVVILDLTVPGGMGGEEAIKTLRTIDPKIKAIISSGYSDTSIMANFRDYGFRDVLSKPCKNPAELNNILHRVMRDLHE